MPQQKRRQPFWIRRSRRVRMLPTLLHEHRGGSARLGGARVTLYKPRMTDGLRPWSNAEMDMGVFPICRASPAALEMRAHGTWLWWWEPASWTRTVTRTVTQAARTIAESLHAVTGTPSRLPPGLGLGLGDSDRGKAAALAHPPKTKDQLERLWVLVTILVRSKDYDAGPWPHSEPRIVVPGLLESPIRALFGIIRLVRGIKRPRNPS